jgi:hypothetical protein
LAALVAAGCAREDVAAPQVSLHTTPTGGKALDVCKVGPEGTFGNFTITADGGQLPLGSSFQLSAHPVVDPNACTMVWYADDPAAIVTAVVTEVGGSPGMVLDRIAVFASLDGPQNIEDPVDGSVTVRMSFTTGALVAFKNTGIPIEEECKGLTPGYWKNWRNHYTAAQFASLLPGTIAGSIAEADAIFATKGKDPIAKLRWFVLANQLTLNLVGTDLPNPDDAVLGASCDALGGGDTLGGTLATALDMLAHPGNYTTDQILWVKDILDAIANME